MTDPSDENIFGYVQRVLTSAEVLFFPQTKIYLDMFKGF